MSPPSCATAGRTRVSISSRIWATISASAGSSSISASGATWMPPALAGAEQRRVAGEMVEQDLEHLRLQLPPFDAGRRGDRDEVAAEEHALDLAGREDRLGERRGLGLFGRWRNRACPPPSPCGRAGTSASPDWAWFRSGSAWMRCGLRKRRIKPAASVIPGEGRVLVEISRGASRRDPVVAPEDVGSDPLSFIFWRRRGLGAIGSRRVRRLRPRPSPG